MAKILLVEDDNNLREIYEARLQAEGYDIVAARDGEEALTVAMKERPDLIISDVMMPKISGFDMLDIIRSTEETKNVKVIMMTALSQAEDKERATKLGADRYLVKSQVTLEDVAKVAREVLNGESDQDKPAAASIPQLVQTPIVEVAATAPATAQVDTPEIKPLSEPTTAQASVAPEPDAVAAASSPASQDPQSSTAPVDVSTAAMSAVSSSSNDLNATTDTTNGTEEDAIAAQIESFIEVKKTEQGVQPVAEPAAAITPEPVPEPVEEETDASEKTGKKIIQPISDPTQSKGPDLDALLSKEVERQQMAEIAKSVASEHANVSDELSAGSALRAAARNPAVGNSAGAEEEFAPAVSITENGDLKVQTPPEENPAVEEPAEPAVNISDVPKVDSPAEPIIPHSNGSSIDGVVAQPPVQPKTAVIDTATTSQPSAQTDEKKPLDPDLIAL